MKSRGTQWLKEVGFQVCEPYFRNEAAMTTFVLRRLNSIDKRFTLTSREDELVKFWEEEIADTKKILLEVEGTPYEPKPWECLSHFILD